MEDPLRLSSRHPINPQIIRQTMQTPPRIYLYSRFTFEAVKIELLTGVCIRQGDVVAASPLNVISYSQGGSSPESQQTFRIYYQSALGNIKEAVSNGLTSWQSAL